MEDIENNNNNKKAGERNNEENVEIFQKSDLVVS